MTTNTLNLTESEIQEITGAVRRTTQVKRLREMGITVIVRPDGRPLVARQHYLLITGSVSTKQKAADKPTPDFGALTHVA